MAVSKTLLDILACPKCKGEIEYDEDRGIICRNCRLLYRVEEDIPIMLEDEAQPFKD